MFRWKQLTINLLSIQFEIFIKMVQIDKFFMTKSLNKNNDRVMQVDCRCVIELRIESMSNHSIHQMKTQ